MISQWPRLLIGVAQTLLTIAFSQTDLVSAYFESRELSTGRIQRIRRRKGTGKVATEASICSARSCAGSAIQKSIVAITVQLRPVIRSIVTGSGCRLEGVVAGLGRGAKARRFTRGGPLL